MLSFAKENMRNCTSLSSAIHTIQDKKITYEVSWKILRKAYPYRIGGKECDLCLTESLEILNPSSFLVP